ncbi:DMT family transporter [Azospirillum argentinense]|uniref:DMT family transporter n=1 Tax=Azospirillum brasilense TaxID=192 RepID=A0A4D8QKA0_AZOBR|nr:DMT family transporter [Azospirillum argentinense]QCO07329.1 DMT family transporter [Azospirillum argentinense]
MLPSFFKRPNAAAWAIYSAFLFTFGGAVAKYLSSHGLTAEQLGFFRSVGALGALAVGIIFSGRSILAELRQINNLMWFSIRCGTGLLAGYCILYAWTSGQHLALINLIVMSRVLFMQGAAMMLLGERASWRVWSAVVAGLIGVIVTVYPALSVGLDLGIIAALAGAMLSAVSLAAVRRLTSTNPAHLIVLVFMAASALGMAPLAYGAWVPFEIGGWVLAGLIAVGILAAGSQIATAKALAAAPLPYVSCFDYLTLPATAIVGWLVFGKEMTGADLIGAALIVASATYLSFAEKSGSAAKGRASHRETATA